MMTSKDGSSTIMDTTIDMSMDMSMGREEGINVADSTTDLELDTEQGALHANTQDHHIIHMSHINNIEYDRADSSHTSHADEDVDEDDICSRDMGMNVTDAEHAAWTKEQARLKIHFAEHNAETFGESFSDTESDSTNDQASVISSFSQSLSSTAAAVAYAAFVTLPGLFVHQILRCVAMRAVRRRLGWALLSVLSLFLGLFIAAKYQEAVADGLPDTKTMYQTGRVCAMEQLHNSGSNSDPQFLAFMTMDSPDAANQRPDTTIAHCGDCGQCSNPHDIKIYDDTKSTLFRDTLYCSKKSVTGGAEVVRECLDEYVGFTEGCNDCWVENVMCDVRNCLFACMWHAMFNKVDAGSGQHDDDGKQRQQALNACTKCDERRCGPAFITCAGANRRRSGIMSEFQRSDDAEVCHDVQVGWWQNDELQNQFKQQEGMDQ